MFVSKLGRTIHVREVFKKPVNGYRDSNRYYLITTTTLAAGRADLENVKTTFFLGWGGGGCLRLLSSDTVEPVG